MRTDLGTALQRFPTTLLFLLLAGLTACGGGSGDGNGGGGGNGVNTGAGDFLCTGHTATTVNVIGNNTYEFIADAGKCFGAQTDHDLVKQAVDVVPVQTNVTPQTDSIVAVSAVAKLTSNRVPASSGGYLILNLAVEMTNTSASDVCVEIGGAELEEQDDSDMTEIELELLGDMFYGKVPAYRFHRECIPPGETRVAWGSETESSAFRPGEDLNALDHIRILFTVRIPDGINEYYLPALTPNEAVWTSTKQSAAGDDFFFYDITNDFINNNAGDIVFHYRSVDIIYFDENDYIVYSSLTSIDDYLGIDDSDLVDQDYVAAAMGGGIGVLDRGGPIAPSLGALTWINGRASKIVIGLDVCDNLAFPSQCF